jgi:hypothetical protein
MLRAEENGGHFKKAGPIIEAANEDGTRVGGGIDGCESYLMWRAAWYRSLRPFREELFPGSRGSCVRTTITPQPF